jgi:hypothetical protein
MATNDDEEGDGMNAECACIKVSESWVLMECRACTAKRHATEGESWGESMARLHHKHHVEPWIRRMFPGIDRAREDGVTFGPTIPLADFDPKMAERLSASVEPNPEPLTITDVDHKTGTVTVRGAKR